jgi:uncharacterized protein
MTAQQLKPLALVTGASSGIGYALAEQFAANGYDLVITSDDQSQLSEAARALSASSQATRIETVRADLSTSEGVNALYHAVQRLGQPIDVLAANAGVGVSGDFARETDLDDELRLVHLNVTSQVHLIKLVLGDMIARGSGRVLITSSIAGVFPGPYMAVYAASKAFLRSFGQAIRYELKETPITVTVLMPGPTDTEFFERADMMDTPVAQGTKDDAADVAKAAYEALMRGDDHVVTGARNKLQAGVAKIMPDKARAAVHAKQSKPQDRH